jgi:hypothetical protein
MPLSPLQAIICTDQPVGSYDPLRAEVVPEVLDIDGLQLPQRVPLVDSHRKDSVRNVLGSVDSLRRTTEAGLKAVRGLLHFTDANRATWQLYEGGHVDALSVGARRLAIRRHADGSVTVTKSELVEVSTVVKGADPAARVVRRLGGELTGEQRYTLHRDGILDKLFNDDPIDGEPEYQQELVVLRRCFPDANIADLCRRAVAEVDRRNSRRYWR